MQLRKELAQIASPKRMSKVLGVTYTYARNILSGNFKKYNLLVINDLIFQLEEFLKKLKQTAKEM